MRRTAYVNTVRVVSARIVQLLDWGAVKNWPTSRVYFSVALNINISKYSFFLPLGLQKYLV